MTAPTDRNRVDDVMLRLRHERAFGRVAAGPVCSDAIALIEDLVAERDAWREIADARNALIIHYRSGSLPSQKVLERIDNAKARLAAALGETP